MGDRCLCYVLYVLYCMLGELIDGLRYGEGMKGMGWYGGNEKEWIGNEMGGNRDISEDLSVR